MLVSRVSVLCILWTGSTVSEEYASCFKRVVSAYKTNQLHIPTKTLTLILKFAYLIYHFNKQDQHIIKFCVSASIYPITSTGMHTP